jgi:arginine decarboxylase
MARRGVKTPILFRFEGIIWDRLERLFQSFDKACREYEYEGSYRLAFPIKVNQQRHVIDSVRKARSDARLGLEVGSKPELVAMLAAHNTPDSLLLCNGYKDDEYIELALLNRKLGRRTIITVEQLYEIDMILDVAKKLDVQPEIGIRFKPSGKGFGRWESSAGPKAKFGLTAHEVVQAMDLLKQRGAGDSLKLLHFHVGSQITSISALKDVLREASQMYTEVAKEFPSLCFWDVGGGLAVDYDGSRTTFDSSMNYTIDEYAMDVVAYIHEACESANIPAPDIISESGRAILAHHAVLVTEVTDVMLSEPEMPDVDNPPGSCSELLELCETAKELTLKNCLVSFHDMQDSGIAIEQLFKLGQISLRERAFAQQVISASRRKIINLSKQLSHIPEEIALAREKMTDTYFCNFSVFQSVPDFWAIGQLFPTIPLQRLDEEPTQRGIIADLTCDSDGKIDKFIDLRDVANALPLHTFREDEPYYIGFFLVGAYQEILGDLHNLFGDTHAVHIHINEDGSYEIPSLVEGDTVKEVLKYVQYDSEELEEQIRTAIDLACRYKGLSDSDAAYIRARYRDALGGYTYLVKHN